MTFVALYIDHNIPPPSPVRSPIGQAMQALEVGDSFMITETADYAKARARWSDFLPARFAMRRVGNDGWRLWRVA